jgi:hypothetical protein
VILRPRRVKRAKPGYIGPIGRYVKHAERFGVECVFETAIKDPEFAPDPRERVERLAKLAAHLEHMDRSWRSPVPVALAPYLVRTQGHSIETVAVLCGCSPATIRRELREGLGLRAARNPKRKRR